MGLLKVPEFAKKYGIERTNVYTYQKRKKLIITEGYVDEENPINKIFIESRPVSNKIAAIQETKKEYKTKIPDTSQPENVEETQKTKRIIRAVNDPLYLEYQHSNKLKDQKLEEEIRLSKLRNDRMQGKLIPTEYVRTHVGELISRYQTIFTQQTEQLIRDTLNELQADNIKITETCSKLIDIANNSSKQSVTEVKIILNNIINEK